MKTYGRYVAAAPDLALGLTMLLTWIAPRILARAKPPMRRSS